MKSERDALKCTLMKSIWLFDAQKWRNRNLWTANDAIRRNIFNGRKFNVNLHICGNLLSPRENRKWTPTLMRIELSLGWILYANVCPLTGIYLVTRNILKSMFWLSIENWLSCTNKEMGNKRDKRLIVM